MKNTMLSLMRLLAGIAIVVPSVHAEVLSLTVGDGNVNPGGNVTIPITVNFDYDDPWFSADMTLQWNSGVLTYSSASPVSPFTTATFSSATPGQLGFSWFNGAGSTVTNGATIFDLTLTANESAPLEPTAISFITGDSSKPLEVGFLNLGPVSPDTTISGVVTVVPEPVNCALAGLACVFIGIKSVRWIIKKRAAQEVR